MKVLLTGSNGFLGSYIKSHITEYDFLFLDRKRIHELNWNNIVGVIHCAGLAHNSYRKSDYEKYYEANVKLTKILYDGHLKSNSTFFIYISSSTVYEGVSKNIIYEDDIGKNLSIYANTKLLAEKYIIENNLSTKKYFIIRPSIIVGPSPKGNLLALQKLINMGIPIPISTNLGNLNLTDIRNILYVLIQLISKKDMIQSNVFNVVDDTMPNLMDIIKYFFREKKFKYQIRYVLIPKRISIFLLSIIKAFNYNFFKSLNKVYFNDICISTERLKKNGIQLPYNSFK